MKDWTQTFAEDLWLGPDEVGAEEARFIYKALRLRKGSRVLDAPCGAGRITIHLAHAGCVVTGLDLMPSFTRRAAARFRKEGVTGRFIAQDIRRMEFDGEFDGVCCWLGGCGYFSEPENRNLIARYARALRNGGRLLVNQINREWLLRHFIVSHTKGRLTMRNRWNRRAQRVESDWMVNRDGRTEHNRLSIRLYTPRQMRDLLEEAGLTFERAYGSHHGEPFSRATRRMIVVARKSEAR